VLDAFGVDRGSLVHLEGGQGYTWRAGDLVLKAGVEPRFVAWLCEVGGTIRPDGFRLATQVPALDGRLVVGGWSATTWLDGDPRPADVDALLEVSAALHRSLLAAGLAWPNFLRGRTDRWAAADRVAWGEEAPPRFAPGGVREVLRLVGPFLQKAWRRGAPQVVHGDLGGNVLFDDAGGGPPGVIDLSPYHRPAAFADAVVVADAVAWHGVAISAAEAFAAGSPRGHELLARAVVFRVLAGPDEVAAYRAVAEVAATG